MMANFFNIQILWLKFVRHRMLAMVKILFLAFFLSSCETHQSSYPLTSTERESLSDFFSYFLFEEGGAYTLFGDKPMTFDVITSFPSDPEDRCITQKTWENGWKKIQDKMETPFYLLFERKAPLTESRAVFLVNISATALIMKNHYSEFKNIAGFDFDPLQTVFEIENEHSPFWEKVLSNEYLLGILLGYGDSNAWLHHSWAQGKNQGGKAGHFLESMHNKSPSSNARAKTKEDILFHLPTFGCFSQEESEFLIQKYQGDREKIRKIYQGKDLVDITLDHLTSNDLAEDPDKDYKTLYLKVYR